jgi:hypothetical protein
MERASHRPDLGAAGGWSFCFLGQLLETADFAGDP